MKLLYFAWVRQRTGIGQETVELPENIDTVGDLVNWLKARGPGFEDAFADPRFVRAAVDQAHAPFETSIKSAREIAFFPPVTGG